MRSPQAADSDDPDVEEPEVEEPDEDDPVEGAAEEPESEPLDAGMLAVLEEPAPDAVRLSVR